MLRIENLTKYYGKTLGVKNLSLTLNNGEIFGFIGPNGAGKSTTIRSIMNLINKTEGKVYIDGELFTQKNEALKKEIGYLPSEINLYGELTVNQMIKYNATFYENIDFEKVKYLTEKLQLDTSKKIEELSFGNLKKLGIVLALMHNPKLIIMDEATNGLDPLMQNAFYDILRKEKERGATIFYSSHNLTEVRNLCDRVGIIREGELKKVETIENLIDGNIHIVTLACEKPEIADKLSDKFIEKNEDKVKFIYSGNIDKLISLLSGVHIEKLLIEDPSLEDIFMHYYR
jgi:ABC-2 type transport system ATP-binding protein